MQKVVGLLGLRGSGKDTAALALVEKGWERVAFADALYLEVSAAFGVSVEFLRDRDRKEVPQAELALNRCTDPLFVAVMLEDMGLPLREGQWPQIEEALRAPRSPREILQKWGTEYRRMHFSDNYWRDQVAALIKASPQRNFVVTDVRFPDEARLLEREFEGKLARVVRPGLAGQDDPALQHASEQAMLRYPVPYEFVNEEGLDKLQAFQGQVVKTFH